MEVPAGQDGIQRLLAAEQEAQAIVAKARKAKSERLKRAKEEAEREVVAYKAERDADFKRRVAEDSTSSAENVARLAEESARAVEGIKASVASKKADVLSLLLGQVTTVRVAVPAPAQK